MQFKLYTRAHVSVYVVIVVVVIDFVLDACFEWVSMFYML